MKVVQASNLIVLLMNYPSQVRQQIKDYMEHSELTVFRLHIAYLTQRCSSRQILLKKGPI